MTTEERMVELDNEFIVIAVPASSLEVDISAKVWHKGEVIQVQRTMKFDEVKEAFEEAKNGYIPQDAVFVLNEDISKSKLERLVSRYLDKQPEDEPEDDDEEIYPCEERYR